MRQSGCAFLIAGLSLPSSQASPPCLQKDAQRPTRHLVVLAAATAAATFLTMDMSTANALQKEVHLAKCRGDVACVSTTSVGNPGKFAPPWRYSFVTPNADVAWAALKDVVGSARGAHVVQCEDGPDTYYLKAEFVGGIDEGQDVEFSLLKKDGVVGFRSASRKAVFVYPFQTPIGGESNKRRLNDFRVQLGWPEVGALDSFVDDGV